MSEKPMTAEEIRAMAEQLIIECADKGRLIEAGWVTMRLLSLPCDVSEAQLHDMRIAFFSGAHHVFTSLLGLLDGDAGEPTTQDLRRMDQIDAELRAFSEEFQRKWKRGKPACNN